MDLLAEIITNVLAGEAERVSVLTQDALGQGLPPKRILDAALTEAMTRVGQRFQAHEIYLPDVLLAAQAMQAGLERLKPLLTKAGVPTRGRVVLGSVQGDLHDIGKNLVGVMLRGAGFEVLDLGYDVAPERFVETARQQQVAVIGMSALLTTTMPGMGRVVQLLGEQGLAGRIKTIIGGAPVSAEFAHKIGADAYGYDAANAVDRVKSLIRPIVLTGTS